MLHIVVVFIHLGLRFREQCIFAKSIDFDLGRGISGTFTILLLHALLTSKSHCHLPGLLLILDKLFSL